MRIGPWVAAAAVALSAAAITPRASSAPASTRDLNLKQKVGQLVMFAPRGQTLSATEKEIIRRHHIGGVILFSGNYRDRSQLARLTAQVQRVARSANEHRIGALIAVDQEGGVVKRFPDMPPRYSAPQIGKSRDTELAFDQGRATGRALRDAGVNVNLAPVADLDLPPEHVMRSRSFGPRARLVGRMANAFSRGLQSRGTAATAKHFPGFGGATVNSDHGRAYIYRSKRQLHTIDAVPFHRAIDGGIRMIMLSHGMYVNDGGDRPASVNHYIATKRLRGEFGFEGVSISDALEPVAWKFGGSTARACEATIRAGVDIALITGDAGAAAACVREIRGAVRSGDIGEARINRGVTRVLELKRWLGLQGRP
jgi:beta-N-acetylhexosaminidase